ncbi:hypothetical protein ILUMI_16048, partial [Ignelater luminosus]
ISTFTELIGKVSPVAGLDWLRGFMKRHENDISLCKPENTSIHRAMAFNKPVVDDFFSKYISVLEKYKFKPDEIWNLDETGLTTVMPLTKVVAPKDFMASEVTDKPLAEGQSKPDVSTGILEGSNVLVHTELTPPTKL